MHGPDGTDYPNIATYYEAREREALVYDYRVSEGKPPLFRVSVILNRCFDAPLDHVCAKCTGPGHLAQWLPPEGMDLLPTVLQRA